MTFFAVNAFVCTNFDMICPVMLFCPMYLCFHFDNSFTVMTKFCGGLVMFTNVTMIEEILLLITNAFCAIITKLLVSFCFCVRAVEISNCFGGLNCVSLFFPS